MTMMDKEGRVPNCQSEIEKFLESGKAMEAVIETGRLMNVKYYSCRSAARHGYVAYIRINGYA